MDWAEKEARRLSEFGGWHCIAQSLRSERSRCAEVVINHVGSWGGSHDSTFNEIAREINDSQHGLRHARHIHPKRGIVT